MPVDPRTKLTLRQIQKLRGIPPRTLRGAIERGRLRAEQVGPVYLISLADLDVYIASKYQGAYKPSGKKKTKAGRR